MATRDIIIQHVDSGAFDTLTKVVQVPIQGAFDATRIFVHLNNPTNSHSATPTTTWGGSVCAADNVDNTNGWVDVVAGAPGFATVTFRCPNAGAMRRMTAQLWQYVGAPGGQNEFLVRANASRNFTSGTPLGGSETMASTGWTYSHVDNLVVFHRGNQILNTFSGQVRSPLNTSLFCWNFGGTDLFNFTRGLTWGGSFAAHFSVVDFVGAAYTCAFATNSVATGINEYALNKTIPDWNRAFIYGRRRSTTDSRVCTIGIVFMPGSDGSKIKTYVDAGSYAGGNNDWVAKVVYNPNFLVERQNSIDLGGPGFGTVGNNSPQTAALTVQSIDQIYTAEDHAFFFTMAMGGVHNYSPMYEALFELVDLMPLDSEIRMFRPRSKGECAPDTNGGVILWALELVRVGPLSEDEPGPRNLHDWGSDINPGGQVALSSTQSITLHGYVYKAKDFFASTVRVRNRNCNAHVTAWPYLTNPSYLTPTEFTLLPEAKVGDLWVMDASHCILKGVNPLQVTITQHGTLELFAAANFMVITGAGYDGNYGVGDYSFRAGSILRVQAAAPGSQPLAVAYDFPLYVLSGTAVLRFSQQF